MAIRPSPQQLFDDRYRVVRELGEGGFGKVLLVQDTEHGDRLLALKLLSHSVSDELIASYFRGEIELLRELPHPDIPKILNDRRTPAGEFYFTMEYVEGRNLEDIVEKEAPLRVRRSLRILGQLLDVLVHTHARNVIHRDLKPSNIIVQKAGAEDEHVKVLDFGVAKVLDKVRAEAAMKGTIVGTRQYMPPEQYIGGPVDERSDLYSVGVIAHRMLTGAFPRANGGEAGARAAKGGALPLDESIPYELRVLMQQLLEVDREKRPSTIETRRRIAALAGERLPGPVPNPWRKRVVAGIAIAAAALIGTVAWMAWQRNASPADTLLRVVVLDQAAGAVSSLRVVTGRDTLGGVTDGGGTVVVRVSGAGDAVRVVSASSCLRAPAPYRPTPVDLQRGQCEIRVARLCASIGVRSTPSGARVVLDAGTTSQRGGETPMQFDDLKAGRHTLRFTADGYVGRDTALAVRDGQSVALEFVLARRAASRSNQTATQTVTPPPQRPQPSNFRKQYQLSTFPSVAEVYVDGETQSCTDAFGGAQRELGVGNHRFRVRAGDLEVVLSYEVKEGDTNNTLVLDFQTRRVRARP